LDSLDGRSIAESGTAARRALVFVI
jgi:hypothetical protein